MGHFYCWYKALAQDSNKNILEKRFFVGIGIKLPELKYINCFLEGFVFLNEQWHREHTTEHKRCLDVNQS